MSIAKRWKKAREGDALRQARAWARTTGSLTMSVTLSWL